MCDPVGFLFYCVILFSIYFSAFLKQKIVLKIVLFFIAILSAFRGTAGVDTPLYMARFTVIDEVPVNFFEPIMPLVMKLVKSLGGDFFSFSVVWALLIYLAYIIFLNNKTNSQKLFYFIFPVLYVDSLYNGLRIGLAYPIILISFSHSRKVKNFFLSILSNMTHISTVIRYVFNFKFITLIFFAALTFTLWSYVQMVIPLNILYKLNRYENFEVLNFYGGIADLSCIILLVFLLFRSKYLSLKELIIITLLILPFHFIVTVEFAAILRIYRLIIVCILGLYIDKLYTNSYFYFKIFGFLYIVNFLRQISSTCNYENGFLPL